MYFRQFYLGCLAHASYLIGSAGEAAVVDPQRDVGIYLEDAKANGLAIRYVIETHLHADFVSGHLELAARTGAKVVFGRKAPAKFDFVAVQDGTELRVGNLILRFLETPGHTPESISIVVVDPEEAVPYGVLTGDALFIGDVGRPDLLGSRMPATELAGMLFDSLHHKLLKLPDAVRVFPAHGAGSMCGRNISSERSSTVGHERQFNYALQPMAREDFIKLMTTDLPEAPEYFSRDAVINMEGAPALMELPSPKALSPAAVRALQASGGVVLDCRPSAQYANAHILMSLHVALSGQFASWAGSLLAPETPIILVAEDDAAVLEARTRLARVGLDRIAGFLDGGILAWDRAGMPLRSIEQISVEELQHRMEQGSVDRVLDVRRSPEWESGHVAGAQHAPLNHLVETVSGLPEPATHRVAKHDQRIAVMCAGGFRSAIAASLLERSGFQRVSNVVGGMAAWANSKMPVAV